MTWGALYYVATRVYNAIDPSQFEFYPQPAEPLFYFGVFCGRLSVKNALTWRFAIIAKTSAVLAFENGREKSNFENQNLLL